jgi:Flp pilus assembly protein TadG
MRKLARTDRGAALIETALILPLLLLLTFGIWATARAWNIRNTMEHAAREGVRFAATELPWTGTPSENAVRDVINAELATTSILPGSVDTVCIDLDAAPCGFAPVSQGYDQVAVQIQWPGYQLNFLFFQMQVDLNVEAVGRYEG